MTKHSPVKHATASSSGVSHSAPTAKPASAQKSVLDKEHAKHPVAHAETAQADSAHHIVHTENAVKAVDATEAVAPAVDVQASAAEVAAVGTAESAAAGAATGAAAISPLAIGAGVLGVVAVAAAAGGGGSGGGSSSSQPLAQHQPTLNKPNSDGHQHETTNPSGTTNSQGADQQGLGINQPDNTQSGNAQPGADQSGSKPPAGADHTDPQTSPADPDTLPHAQANASADQKGAHVASEGYTDLGDTLGSALKNSAPQGTAVQFVKITHIDAAQSSETGSRIVHFGEFPADGAPIATHDALASNTAYEVYKLPAGQSMTWEEAAKKAQELGGKLVAFDSKAEADFVLSGLAGKVGANPANLDDLKNGAWVGLKQDPSAEKPDTGWNWVNGKPLSADSWKAYGASVNDKHGPFDGNATPGAETHKADFGAMILNGNTEDAKAGLYDYSGKLSQFVIEYNNYKLPLSLNGQPVAEGQIIKAEDFSKLVWNSTTNSTGKISFQAVSSDDAQTAKPLEGSKEHSFVLTESADIKHAGNASQTGPANTDGNPDASGAAGGQPGGTNTNTNTPHPAYPDSNAAESVTSHDNAAHKLDAAIFQGADAAKGPEYIKIIEVKPTSGDDGANPLSMRDGNETIPQADGSIINKANFDKLFWDASKNEGGTIKFQVVSDAKGEHPVADVKEQTISIYEQPVKPDYSAGHPEITVEHGGKVKIAATEFQGKDGHSPAAVRIDDIHSGSLLKVDGAQETSLHNGDKVMAADFGKLVWEASKGSGIGTTLSFTALDKDGHPFVDADKQVITIFEQPAAPDYPAHQPEQSVTHDQTTDLSKTIFTGSDSKAEPAFIKITAIKDGANADTTQPVLLLKPSAAAAVIGEGTPKILKTGSIISHDDLGRIEWDASKTEGGSFSFQALDKHEAAIKGSEVQTVTIYEPTPPTYGDGNSLKVDVGHDAKANISADIFKGTGTPPDAIKIVGTVSPGALSLKADDGTISPVQENQVIKKEDFGKLVWDASKSADSGSSFTFDALDKTGAAFAGHHIVSIHEAPASQGADQGAGKDPTQGDKAQAGDSSQTGGEHSAQQGSGTPPAASGPSSPAGSGAPTDQAGKAQADGQPKAGSEQTNQQSDPPAADHSNPGGQADSNAQSGDQKQQGNVTQPPANDPSSQAGSETPADQSGKAQADGHPSGDEHANQQGAHEAAPPQAAAHTGEYPAAPVKVDVKIAEAHHNLEAKLLSGDTDAKIPDAVEIISVKDPGHQDTGAVLKLDKGGAADVTLNGGQYVDKADFGKLYWDASASNHESGTYTVTFKPVDASHQEITGATEHTFNVHEVAEAPVYSSPLAEQKVSTHDGDLQFDKSLFIGTDANKAPMYIKITEILPTADDGQTADAKTALYLDKGDSDHHHNIVANSDPSDKSSVLSSDQFGKLHWDAAHNKGGTFKFQALDGDFKAISDSPEQTVTVTEADAPAAMGPESKSLSYHAAQLTTLVDTLEQDLLHHHQPVL
ncbi:MAG: lectin-like protein [Lautropia sp.]|nr:lectin-like protein [Lautropia sp.]